MEENDVNEEYQVEYLYEKCVYVDTKSHYVYRYKDLLQNYHFDSHYKQKGNMDELRVIIGKDLLFANKAKKGHC